MSSVRAAVATAEDAVWRVLDAHGAGGVAGRGLTLVRGVGARLEDDRGRTFVDCVSGHGAASLGHAHPALTAAIARQARQLVCAPASFGHRARAQLLGHLARVTGYGRFFLVNSGAEAVEAALKYARFATGRAGIVACRRGFHGRTLGALSATSSPKYRRPFAPLVPGVEHVPFGDIEALDAAVDDSVAAVLLEPVQGEGGVHPSPPGYLRAARRICDRAGALLVLDEVQTGFGRTGRWLAQDHWLDRDDPAGRADVVALAKGLGGGVPIGAMALRPGLEPFPIGLHGSTFGGNPLSCAAAAAVLGVLERDDLPARAERLGAWATRRLADALADVPRVRAVRGLGLMVAIELRERVAPWLRRLQEEERILALSAGSTVLRLLPPLVIPQDDWRDVVERLATILAEDAP